MRDPTTLEVTLRTLRIGGEATLLAAVPGVPLGAALGLGRFRGRRAALAVFNAGLRLPPVAVGHGLWLLMWPSSAYGGGPLAGLGWIYTLDAVILAQAVLALPILVALTSAAVQAVPVGLLEQARAFGARRRSVAALALREARTGVLAGLVAALGTAMASIGAVLVVGSQVNASTLPSAALSAYDNGGQNHRALVLGTTMLALFAVVAAALTLLQHGTRPRWLPVRS